MKADGNLSNYYPDFIVKVTDKLTVIAETKGQEDSDVRPKIERLKQSCEDVNRVQSQVMYDFVYVDDAGFKKYKPKSFGQLLETFTEYKGRQ